MKLREEGIKGFIKTIYKISNKTCFFSLIIPIVGLLSNIFSLFGNSFKDIFAKVSFIYDVNGNLTLWTKSIVIIFIIVSLVFTIVKHIGDKWNLISDGIIKELFEKLLNVEIGLRTEYYKKTREVIKEGKYKDAYKNLTNCSSVISPYTERTSRLNSVNRIEKIILRSVDLLSEVWGINENNINISLIYKRDATSNSNWEILCQKNLNEVTFDLDYLMNHEECMFNKVLISPERSEFYLSKLQAYKDRKFVKCLQDTDDVLNGSIYCKNLSIYDSKGTLVKGFALSIATDQYAFCDDDVFQENLCKKIFKVVEDNIKKEIWELYVIEYLGLGGI